MSWSFDRLRAPFQGCRFDDGLNRLHGSSRAPWKDKPLVLGAPVPFLFSEARFILAGRRDGPCTVELPSQQLDQTYAWVKGAVNNILGDFCHWLEGGVNCRCVFAVLIAIVSEILKIFHVLLRYEDLLTETVCIALLSTFLGMKTLMLTFCARS